MRSLYFCQPFSRSSSSSVSDSGTIIFPPVLKHNCRRFRGFTAKLFFPFASSSRRRAKIPRTLCTSRSIRRSQIVARQDKARQGDTAQSHQCLCGMRPCVIAVNFQPSISQHSSQLFDSRTDTVLLPKITSKWSHCLRKGFRASRYVILYSLEHHTNNNRPSYRGFSPFLEKYVT